MQKLKITAILQNLTDAFYERFLALSNADKLADLEKLRRDLPSAIKLKCGNGSFRDRVDANSKLRSNPEISFKLEPRRGYKLATFEF